VETKPDAYGKPPSLKVPGVPLKARLIQAQKFIEEKPR
jgi:hypothetical protein